MRGIVVIALVGCSSKQGGGFPTGSGGGDDTSADTAGRTGLPGFDEDCSFLIVQDSSECSLYQYSRQGVELSWEIEVGNPDPKDFMPACRDAEVDSSGRLWMRLGYQPAWLSSIDLAAGGEWVHHTTEEWGIVANAYLGMMGEAGGRIFMGDDVRETLDSDGAFAFDKGTEEWEYVPGLGGDHFVGGKDGYLYTEWGKYDPQTLEQVGTNPVIPWAVGPGGELYAVDDGILSKLDPSGKKTLASFDLTSLVTYEPDVTEVALHDDGTVLVISQNLGTMMIEPDFSSGMLVREDTYGDGQFVAFCY